MDSVWLNVVLFLWFDFSSPCNMHPLYQVISLYVYAINYRTFYFCTFSHFVKKKRKKKGGILRSRIHPIVWVVIVLFLTPLPVRMDTCMWVRCMFVFLCVFCGLLLCEVLIFTNMRENYKILWRTCAVINTPAVY